ncbi:lytic murein transglycosylase [Paracoccus seriniphilus]|uniref:Membrane-bound lytic murein transglycosylase B n=1 Tax=Paracoccus seriniphilus TaxID=184748 RepID=A0A239PSS2_9RHOB|nr:lytic murein transglycosylase [Paracoccus seriniphilus]WCR14204.1 lytic murein transglycosylase [Paracoccus seriniphilus]SNT73103.1 membrane-bound lytic murein transglycosylase B [Paracoccus seriniphilus]
MSFSRFLVTTTLVGALAACAGPTSRTPGSYSGSTPVTPSPIPAASASDEAGLQRFVQSFRARALSSGVSASTYDRAMRIARYNPDVIRLDRKQAEFSRPVWLYLDSAVSDARIATGREKRAQLSGTLASIEARYGVPREIVLAVWGMESNFGANRGKMQIIPSLATLAYDGRRGEMFQNQLIAALKILQAGDTDAEHMLGSWAGAMGHTQFMPTSYLEYAVDFTGDGRRDIWSDDPTDALASTAAYLARNGWKRGQPWGTEVRLPDSFNMGQIGKGTRKSNSAWAAQGVTRFGGGSLPSGSGSIIMPAGARGPAFLVMDNFRALLRYNNSDNYALGVSFLAERIAGRSGIQGSWPRNDRPLSTSERKEIQQRLRAKGFYDGEIDGLFGSGTMTAVAAFQRSIGVTPDGYPTSILLGQLRK